MKVPNLFGSNPVVRGLVAVSLACAFVAGGAVPLTASAEAAPPVVTPMVAAEASVAPAPPAVPVVIPVAAKKLSIRELVAKVGRDSGLSKTEVAALLWMARRESNFHPNSESSSECHGLFQLSKGMAHGKPWRDPVWNTKRAIKYMHGRYHGVLRAKAFWARHHWY